MSCDMQRDKIQIAFRPGSLSLVVARAAMAECGPALVSTVDLKKQGTQQSTCSCCSAEELDPNPDCSWTAVRDFGANDEVAGECW